MNAVTTQEAKGHVSGLDIELAGTNVDQSRVMVESAQMFLNSLFATMEFISVPQAKEYVQSELQKVELLLGAADERMENASKQLEGLAQQAYGNEKEAA